MCETGYIFIDKYKYCTIFTVKHTKYCSCNFTFMCSPCILDVALTSCRNDRNQAFCTELTTITALSFNTADTEVCKKT